VPPDIVPVDVAVTEFNRSRRTLFIWIRSGRLKRYRIAGDSKTYIDRNELRRLLRPRHEPPEQKV